MKLYPIQFTPILQNRIWGGTKLHDVLAKNSTSKCTGESWEISTVPNAISVVENGTLKGKDLNQIIESFPELILGNRVFEQFGTNFPLLFKFIDAQHDLSIQLHPDDVLAKKRHNSFGKTEMWYVMHADKGARIVVGFKKDSHKEEYVSHLNENTLMDLLEEIPVEKGDVFFLETGTIHAIGAGILLAEIQQTSDITYRLYDWDRKDNDGKGRELHTELALEAINYKKTHPKINYKTQKNTKNELVHCSYFNTNFLVIEDAYTWIGNKGSFTVFMCTEGECTIEFDTVQTQLNAGQTILIPAAIVELKLFGTATLLEIYI